MRKLTLDEKISIKGILAKRDLLLPKLDMASALHFWNMVFCTPLSYYNTPKRVYVAPRREYGLPCQRKYDRAGRSI